MSQSDVARLLASRPSGAAVASLFSDHSDAAIILHLPASRPTVTLAGLGRKIAARTRDILLSQVPCEDILFDTPHALHVARRRAQM